VLSTLVFPRGIVGLFRQLRRTAPAQPETMPVEEQEA